MGCKKLTYYEKPTSPLKVVQDDPHYVVIIAYRIELDNEKVVQGWLLPDPAEQFHNPYLAMGNNPVVFIDPDGEFITWSFHKNGFSIGVNFSPTGIGAGGGLNFGWGDGFSLGVYGEVGYRVGGTGFGA